MPTEAERRAAHWKKFAFTVELALSAAEEERAETQAMLRIESAAALEWQTRAANAEERLRRAKDLLRMRLDGFTAHSDALNESIVALLAEKEG